MIPKWRPEFSTPAGMPLWAMEVYYRLSELRIPPGGVGGQRPRESSIRRSDTTAYTSTFRQFRLPGLVSLTQAGAQFRHQRPDAVPHGEGQRTGRVLQFPKKPPRRIRIHAEASSLTPMDRLEVLFKGKVIRTARGAGKLTVDFTTDVGETGWFAARAFEKPDRAIRFAQTSPVYVEFAGDTGIVPRRCRVLPRLDRP